MQMIPESHLASIGEVASLHAGVLWNRWRRAGKGYNATPRGQLVTSTFYHFNYLLKPKNDVRHISIRRDKFTDVIQCYW